MPKVIDTIIKTCECWNCDSLIEYKPSETYLVTVDNGKMAPKVIRRYLTCPCCKIDIEIVKEK